MSRRRPGVQQTDPSTAGNAGRPDWKNPQGGETHCSLRRAEPRTLSTKWESPRKVSQFVVLHTGRSRKSVNSVRASEHGRFSWCTPDKMNQATRGRTEKGKGEEKEEKRDRSQTKPDGGDKVSRSRSRGFFEREREAVRLPREPEAEEDEPLFRGRRVSREPTLRPFRDLPKVAGRPMEPWRALMVI